MKTTGKLFLALCAAAILGSTLTVVANNYYSQQDNADRNFIRTSSRIPSSNTDFTVAAENTINCVVSIKTFAVARQQYQGNQFSIHSNSSLVMAMATTLLAVNNHNNLKRKNFNLLDLVRV